MNATEKRGYLRALKELLAHAEERIEGVKRVHEDCQAHGDASGEIEYAGALHEAEGWQEKLKTMLKEFRP